MRWKIGLTDLETYNKKEIVNNTILLYWAW